MRPALRTITPYRRPSRARRKSTFYRYRRGISPQLCRLALAFCAVLCAWWLGTYIRHADTVSTSGTHSLPGAAGAPAAHPIPYNPARPLAAPSAADAVLLMSGGPTLDARHVDAILAAYGSPLHGHGAQVVGLSRRFKVDDAIALAFYVMESRAGTQGEAVITRSFGNLRPMPNEPMTDGYRQYATWLDGVSEWFKVIRILYLNHLKLRTVDAVVPVYAPATDSNDPATMIAGIHQLVQCWRGATDLCPDDPPGVRAIVAGH